MTTNTSPLIPRRTQLGGLIQQYPWTHQGHTVAIAYETFGAGTPILLLPAFSTVSSRAEMAGIAQICAAHFQVITLDWLGFGDSDRPRVQYGRSLYSQFLQDFVRDCLDQPVRVVAAGHAAGYAMQLAQKQPGSCSKLMLIAPTWKGPLRAMGVPLSVASGVKNLVRSPLLGQALYALNTHPAFLKWMYQRHVYVDRDKLTPDFITVKHQITQQPGARFAPAAFVTGSLDPMDDREEWLTIGRSLTLPVQMIIPEQAPPKSKAEMEALAALPRIWAERIPGTLGVHEEYATEVGHLTLAFCQSQGSWS